MSAFIGLLYNEYVVIGTDTLATRPYKKGDNYKKPLYYTSKVYHLPQFKSCFASTGSQIIGVKFYEFFTQCFIGKDINSIINVDLKHLSKLVEEADPSCYGSIYLYGYDGNIKKFKGFHLHIESNRKTLKWEPFKSITESIDGFPMAMSPQVANFIDLIEKLLPENSTQNDFIKNGIIILKEEDEKKPVVEQVGIGGDIVLTTMRLNQSGSFIIISEVLHEFSDKESLGELMLKP